MLIFVSDMHLTDQTLAPPVPLDALERFLEEIKLLSRKSKENIEIVFLGDIFDVLRSSQWLVKEITGPDFLYVPRDIRPWKVIDRPLERIVSIILEGINKSYGCLFEELRHIENVKLSWVPGNHDRLVKITEAGKQFLKEIGLSSTDYQILREDYSVLARHGHCYDKYNFRKNDYKLSPLGDAIVIELVNKLQVEVAERSKVTHFNHDDVAFLAAIEYVFPHYKVPVWIRERTESLEEIFRDRVRKAWHTTVKSFQESEPYILLKQRSLFPSFVKLLESPIFRGPLSNIIKTYNDAFEKQPEDYKKDALKEPELMNNSIRYVVYGHTHKPGIYPLQNKRYYINTGWWERSYQPPGLETEPFMGNFYILIIDKERDKPELKLIKVGTRINWGPPSLISPAVSLKEAKAAENPIIKEAKFENGILSLFTDTKGIVVNTLTNSQKQGFDMLIDNKIETKTFGRNVAVEIKNKVNTSDIYNLTNKIKDAGVDNGWIFTLTKVSDRLKKKAQKLDITIFDISDINKFETGESFTRSLSSYKAHSLEF